MRELKLGSGVSNINISESHPLGVRELKLLGKSGSTVPSASHPLGVRELKLSFLGRGRSAEMVAPFRGA